MVKFSWTAGQTIEKENALPTLAASTTNDVEM
jgi:hypothetical protein